MGTAARGFATFAEMPLFGSAKVNPGDEGPAVEASEDGSLAGSRASATEPKQEGLPEGTDAQFEDESDLPMVVRGILELVRTAPPDQSDELSIASSISVEVDPMMDMFEKIFSFDREQLKEEEENYKVWAQEEHGTVIDPVSGEVRDIMTQCVVLKMEQDESELCSLKEPTH